MNPDPTVSLVAEQIQFGVPSANAPQEMFERHAKLHPHAPAVVWPQGTLSYAELDARVERLACDLQHRGIGPGRLVPVCGERSPDLIAGMLGVLRVGAAFVPLDPTLPLARLAHIIGETDATLVLVQPELAATLPSGLAQLVPLDAAFSAPTPQPLPRAPASPDAPAYCIYTSGSSGTPKGVLVGARSIVNLIEDWNSRLPARPHECFSWWTSCSFDVSIFEWLLPLCSGACVALPEESARHDPREFLHWAAQHRVSTAYLPPHIARLLPQLIAQGLVPPSRLLLGVEPLDEKSLHDALAPLDVTIVNGYGPTEATVYATLYTQPLGPHSRPIPIGRPIAGTIIHLLDAQLRHVPAGVPGTIHIAGASLALGYLKHPELTARKFIPCPYGPPGSLMYDTGDRARLLDDGNLAFLGRLDAQVKVRGFRIEPGEIEHALLHTGLVREAAVLAQPDAQGNLTLCACVVPQDGADCDAESLRRALGDWLPSYMLPSTFTTIDRMPLTPAGKLDREHLSIQLTQRDWAEVVRPDFEPPCTDQEKLIAVLWQDLLGIAKIGRHDDFFSLGGHSLLAAQLVATVAARPELCMSFTIRQLFASPTLCQLARVAGSSGPVGAQLVPVRTSGTQSPLFCIHGSDGDLAYAVNLSAGLPEDIPVYGLSETSPDEGPAPELSIVQWASRHAKLILSTQARGPYRLCGWSAGGTIAHEIARQLARDGHAVEALFLIDTRADYQLVPSREPTHLDAGQMRTHRRILSALATHTPEALGLMPHLFVAARETREDASLGWKRLYGPALIPRSHDAGHHDIVARNHAAALGREIGEILSTSRAGHAIPTQGNP